MKTNLISFKHVSRLVLGVTLTHFASLSFTQTPPPNADAFPTFESYIKVSGVAPFTTGDNAAYAMRQGSPTAGSGGIEDFYYTKDTSDTTTVVSKGHALAGAEDYLASVNVTTANMGSIEAGYKVFRTFYDGIGGFFPQSNTFQKLGHEELHTDRGSFWFNVTLAKPDRPVFNVNFQADTRTGKKDSTIWAAIISPTATVTNGILVGNTVPANTPFIAPNVLNMNEHHEELQASVVVTSGKVKETLKGAINWINNNDYRSYVKNPGSNVIASPEVTVLDDQELIHSTNFRILNQIEAKLNDKLGWDIAATYDHQFSTNGGQWITPAYSATAASTYPAVTAGNIYGKAKVDDYVANTFLHYNPTKNWTTDIGIRDEYKVISSRGGFITTSLATGSTSTAASNLTVANDLTYSHETEHVDTPELSLQYLGISNMTVYLNADYRINHANQHWINPYAASTVAGITGVATTAFAPAGSVFFQEADQNNKDLKVGLNWSPSRIITIRAEIFRKDHQNQYVGSSDLIGIGSTGGLYATGYTFTGMKFNVQIKPTQTLSFNTRFQPQHGSMSVLGNTVTGGLGNEITSGVVTGSLLSESIDWSPKPWLYTEGNVNFVYNSIQTAYPYVTVATPPAAIGTPIANADNNYVTAMLLAGFVIDKQTDTNIQGLLTRATNYNRQIMMGGIPYGAAFYERSITVGLKHKLSDRMFAEGKVGYLDRQDATAGGFTNYKGPLVYLSLTCAL